MSLHDVTGTEVDLARSPLRFEVLASASPRAAWGSDPFDRSRVPDGAKMLVEGTLGGLRLIGDGSRSESAVGPFPIERLNYTRNREGRLPFGAYPAYTASPPVPDQAHALARLSESIMAPDVVARRNQVFAALEKAGVAAAPDPDLSVMASSAARVLQAPPVLAHVGANLAAARPGAPLRSFAAIADFRTAGPAAIGSPARRPEIRLVGTLRRGPSADSGVSRARWTRAVARNARRTAAVRRGPPQATSAVLHSGTVTHWSGPVTHVEHRGGLPLRLTCFDANHEPLVDWHDVPGATIALPEGTSAVTLHGGAAAADRATSLAGWRLDDQVLRLNPRWFAGTGFLLRPQGAIDRRAASPGSSDGLLDVAEIADVNRLTDDKAGGWETLFDGARRSVAVRLLRGADPRRVEVAVKRTAAAYEAADRDYAAPVAVVEEPEGTVLFFEVPETPAVRAREHLSVWVESRSGRAVASGVHASFLSADELRRRWRELRSGDEGTTRTDDTFRTSTRVELRSEPAHRE
ncbi:MAG: hypothetical protein JNL97_13210 [Verrucomicrobiales bacterium]|nr:hypothetical protein [Verrucomicrobiales bacterium]